MIKISNSKQIKAFVRYLFHHFICDLFILQLPDSQRFLRIPTVPKVFERLEGLELEIEWKK